MTYRGSSYFRGDAMEDYLASLALYRKPIPTDESSLFRAASEQIYCTQKFHAQLQECCQAYIDRHTEKFENLNQIRAFILALALLYKYDFLIYQEIAKPPVNVTNFGFQRKVILCESFGHHFDCIYPRAFQQKAAICQSVAYEILYKGVFHMDTEVSAAVGLVRKQNIRYHRLEMQMTQSSVPQEFYEQDTYAMPPPNGAMMNSFNGMEMQQQYQNQSVAAYHGNDGHYDGRPGHQPPPSYYLGAPATRRSIRHGSRSQHNQEDEAVRDRELQMAITGPPFPYKVAKALDPVVYRNIEYDVWLEDRKAHFRASSPYFKNNGPYPPGTMCLVHLDTADIHAYFGIVQEVDPSGESVIVFLPELREKKHVQLDRLEGWSRNQIPNFGTNVARQESQTQTRSRHSTWAPINQSPQPLSQAYGSLSWPQTTAGGMWQQYPPPNQQQQMVMEPPMDPSEKNKPNSNMGVPNGPHQNGTLVHYQMTQPRPVMTVVAPMANSCQTINYPWPPPPTLVNMQTPPPPPPQQQQMNMVVPQQNFNQPIALVPLERQPTEEDLGTLRQFYDLGGCEYFRQFLSANQRFPVPPPQQQYQQTATFVLSPHPPIMVDAQLAPMQQMQMEPSNQMWSQ